jgi:hypothetical protein
MASTIRGLFENLTHAERACDQARSVPCAPYWVLIAS